MWKFLYFLTVASVVASKYTSFDYRAPQNLEYNPFRYTLVMGIPTSIPPPTYENDIYDFYLAEGSYLPEGLELNESTGAITGTPTVESGLSVYTIFGSNAYGSTSTTIALAVREGTCKAEGSLPTASVGETLIFDCGLQGLFGGELTRTCVLGSRDGEWGPLKGTCEPLVSITSVSYPQQSYGLPLGQSFSVIPTYEGNYPAFSMLSGTLPDGLTLNEKTGEISGIPTTSSPSSSVGILAANKLGSAQVSISFMVMAAPQYFSYPQTTYSIVKGEAFTAKPSCEGDSVRFRISSGSLPDGLVLSEETGEISGTPSSSSYKVKVSVEAYNDVGSQKVDLVFKTEGVLLWIVIGVIVIVVIVVVVAVILLKKKSSKVLPKKTEV